jgi:phage tail tape-measure protein
VTRTLGACGDGGSDIIAIDGATERLVNAATLGRSAARRPDARAKHKASRRQQAEACSAWDASKQPAWLTSELFTQQIRRYW